MTYKDLLVDLQQLSPEQLQQTVTVYDPYGEEYIPVVDGFETEEDTCDVPDAGHYVIVLKA
jgi:hypothetical protein